MLMHELFPEQYESEANDDTNEQKGLLDAFKIDVEEEKVPENEVENFEMMFDGEEIELAEIRLRDVILEEKKSKIRDHLNKE